MPPASAPFVAAPNGWHWFHWLGDLYGRAVLDLLRYTVRAEESPQPGLCVTVFESPQTVPEWSEHQVRQYLEDAFRVYELLLALGPFQHLLPVALRRRAVVEQFNVARFLTAIVSLHPIVAPDEMSENLAALLIRE